MERPSGETRDPDEKNHAKEISEFSSAELATAQEVLNALMGLGKPELPTTTGLEVLSLIDPYIKAAQEREERESEITAPLQQQLAKTESQLAEIRNPQTGRRFHWLGRRQENSPPKDEASVAKAAEQAERTEPMTPDYEQAHTMGTEPSLPSSRSYTIAHPIREEGDKVMTYSPFKVKNMVQDPVFVRIGQSVPFPFHDRSRSFDPLALKWDTGISISERITSDGVTVPSFEIKGYNNKEKLLMMPEKDTDKDKNIDRTKIALTGDPYGWSLNRSTVFAGVERAHTEEPSWKISYYAGELSDKPNPGNSS